MIPMRTLILALLPATLLAQVPTDPDLAQQSYLEELGIDVSWDQFGVSGQGVVVRIVGESANPSHPDLQDNFLGRFGPAYEGNLELLNPAAGIIAADPNDQGIAGIAYNSRWEIYGIPDALEGPTAGAFTSGNGVEDGRRTGDPEADVIALAYQVQSIASEFDPTGPLQAAIANNVIVVAGASDWSLQNFDSNYVPRNNQANVIVANNPSQDTWGNNIFVSTTADADVAHYTTDSLTDGYVTNDTNLAASGVIAGFAALAAEHTDMLHARQLMHAIAATAGSNEPGESFTYNPTGAGFGVLDSVGALQDLTDHLAVTEQERYLDRRDDLDLTIPGEGRVTVDFGTPESTLPVEQVLLTVDFADVIETSIDIDLFVVDEFGVEQQVGNWVSVAGAANIADDSATFLFNDPRGVLSNQQWFIQISTPSEQVLQSASIEVLSGAVIREAFSGLSNGTNFNVTTDSDFLSFQLDYADTAVSIAEGVTTRLKDGIIMNDGTFTVAGTLRDNETLENYRRDLEFHLNGGTFTVTETGSAEFNDINSVTGGDLVNRGSLSFGKQLNVSNSASVTNSGTLTMSGGNDVVLSDRSRMTNEPTGILDLDGGSIQATGDGFILEVDPEKVEDDVFAPGYFAALIQSNVDTLDDPIIVNDGTLNAESGTLRLDGAHFINGESSANAELLDGQLMAQNGSMVAIGGDFTASSTIRVDDSTFAIEGDFEGANNEMLVENGSNLFVGGALTNTNLLANGSTIVNNGAINLVDGSTMIDSTLVNREEGSITGSSLQVGGDGTVVNNDGTIDLDALEILGGALTHTGIMDVANLTISADFLSNAPIDGLETLTINGGTFTNNNKLNFVASTLRVDGGLYLHNSANAFNDVDVLDIQIAGGGTLDFQESEDQLVNLTFENGQILAADQLTAINNFTVTQGGNGRITVQPFGTVTVGGDFTLEANSTLDLSNDGDPFQIDLSSAIVSLNEGSLISLNFEGNQPNIFLPTFVLSGNVDVSGVTFFLDVSDEAGTIEAGETYEVLNVQNGAFVGDFSFEGETTGLPLLILLESRGFSDEGNLRVEAVLDFDNERFLRAVDSSLRDIADAVGDLQALDPGSSAGQDAETIVETFTTIAEEESLSAFVEALSQLLPRGASVLQRSVMRNGHADLRAVFDRAEAIRGYGPKRWERVEAEMVTADRYEEMARSLLNGNAKNVSYDEQSGRYTFSQEERVVNDADGRSIYRPTADWGWFAQGSFDFASGDEIGDDADFDGQQYLMRVGIDKTFFGGHTVGLVAGSSAEFIDLEDGNGGDQFGYHASLAPFYTFNGDWFGATVTAGYHYGNYTIERGISIGDIETTAEAEDVATHQFISGVRLHVVAIEKESFSFVPYTGLTASSVYIDSYREEGAEGDLNLEVDSVGFFSARAQIGGRLSFRGLDTFDWFRANLDTFYEYEFAYDGEDVDAEFANLNASSFEYEVDYESEHQIRISPSVSFQVSEAGYIYGAYGFTWGSDDLNIHTFDVGYRSRF